MRPPDSSTIIGGNHTRDVERHKDDIQVQQRKGIIDTMRNWYKEGILLGFGALAGNGRALGWRFENVGMAGVVDHFASGILLTGADASDPFI